VKELRIFRICFISSATQTSTFTINMTTVRTPKFHPSFFLPSYSWFCSNLFTTFWTSCNGFWILNFTSYAEIIQQIRTWHDKFSKVNSELRIFRLVFFFLYVENHHTKLSLAHSTLFVCWNHLCLLDANISCFIQKRVHRFLQVSGITCKKFRLHIQRFSLYYFNFILWSKN